MDYHKKYLEYKTKYHLLKKQIGGMDPNPRPNPWGKLPLNPELEAGKQAAREERQRRQQELAEIEARTAQELLDKKRRKEERMAEAKRIEEERLAEARRAEEERLAEEKRTVERQEAERIRKENELATLSLPPELIFYIMEMGSINLERLITARKNPEFKNTVDTFILQMLENDVYSVEKVLKIYNLMPDLKDKMKPIILYNLENMRRTPEQLYYIYMNYDDIDFKGLIMDMVCKINVSSLSLNEIIVLYKMIQKKSFYDEINNRIASNRISLSELVSLYSINEFQMSLIPIINEAYDIKFSSIPNIYSQPISDKIKLLYVAIHFLCNRLIELNKPDIRYAIEIEFLGASAIVAGTSNFTFSYYAGAGNTLIKERLGYMGDNIGIFNFSNLLNRIIGEIKSKSEYGVRIKSVGLVKKISQTDKKNIFKFIF